MRNYKKNAIKKEDVKDILCSRQHNDYVKIKILLCFTRILNILRSVRNSSGNHEM